ncbi:MAG TPA: biotin--[acetyl-CoA-carboxylase] ligase [Desulfobacteraceae bacterium]|jgi:BirA family transcriptional regulator, biotin operon repressor / biotin---[acetyl-CoA-carboxylase] ligase|nr:biotin--[acetyl-CoA-carboxylase] ligase [Desulfobacteraceae bacterium]
MKNHLIEKLKKSGDSWISGQELSTALGVSRSAIWKHIEALRREGCRIEASPRKGYRLKGTPDLLSEDEIRRTLTTTSIGKHQIVYLPETTSTNSVAKGIAAEGAPEGALVVAGSQKEGRGRKGRTWFSPPGLGLYASLVLRPHLPPSEAFTFSLLSALAVADGIASLDNRLHPAVKWPNDVLIENRKVSGILIELATEADLLDYVVVGFGINVNTESFPTGLRMEPTSLLIETGRHIPRITVLTAIIARLEHEYQRLLEKGPDPILSEWRKRCDIEGRLVSVERLDKVIKGIVKSVDRDGSLILEDAQGRIHRIHSGDVAY